MINLYLLHMATHSISSTSAGSLHPGISSSPLSDIPIFIHHQRLILLSFKFQINGIIQYALFFCLNISFIHILILILSSCGKKPFFFHWCIITLLFGDSTIYLYILLNGHLGCFHIWYAWIPLNKHPCAYSWIDICIYYPWVDA